MNSRDVRQLFTGFFEERGHRRIPSASLIPAGDPTLLFTNAGMVQLKPYMTGLARPPAPRLTSIQKCFRTTDIEAVGDGSHHTFFEMLGNFSIGDYFQGEAIPWAWELLTTPQTKGMGLDKSRLWATIYRDDDEAFALWRKVGVPPERIVRYGEKENYWFSGPVGPCGPNSEINYDFGLQFGCGRADCHPNCEEPSRSLPGESCERFLELWNLVFMTLYQAEDGSRTPLPQRNVDTGAGLERWPVPLLWEGGVDWQGKRKEWTGRPDNYDTDLFQPILARIGELAGKSYDDATTQERRAMRILAEHARAATFLIADGVTPSNDGRGYVLRRLIRRAIYHARAIRTEDEGHSLEPVSRAVGALMHGEYPELLTAAQLISRVLSEEEDRFQETLDRGSSALDLMLGFRATFGQNARTLASELESGEETITPGEREATLEAHGLNRIRAPSLFTVPLPGLHDRLVEWPTKLSGSEAFQLYDTFGFPVELVREIARERGFSIDDTGFERALEAQRERSRAAAQFGGDAERIQAYAGLGLPPTLFLGYESTTAYASVAAIVADGRAVHSVEAPAEEGRTAVRPYVEVVLDRTPFYAEGGGQVGDQGELIWAGGRLVVEDTQAVGEGGVTTHVGHLVGADGRSPLRVGDAVEARVDESRRADTMRNHTATHLLHAALRQVLGTHVRQAGSLVAPDRLRFDFTHLEALAPHEIAEVEALANEKVRANIPVHVDYESYDEAIAGGALAFFGDKYAETVRVVGVCEPRPYDPAHPEPVEGGERCFSKELCGGTHCHTSGEVGAIVVTGESSIGAGMRRIEAVTGRAAIEHVRRREEEVAGLAALLRASPSELGARITALQDETEGLRKRLQGLERRTARDEAETLAENATRIGETAVVVTRVSAPSADFLRDLGDGVKSKLGSAVVLLAAVIDGKPSFLAMSTPDVAERVSASDVVRAAASVAGGGGGGRPELAQGGGTEVSKIDAALAAGRRLIEEKLQAGPD